MSARDRSGLMGRLPAQRRDFGLPATLRLIAENLVHAVSPRLARDLCRWDVYRRHVSFDRRYAIRTAGTAEPEVPDGELRYEPTDEASFAWMMRPIDLDWQRSAFVDVPMGPFQAWRVTGGSTGGPASPGV